MRTRSKYRPWMLCLALICSAVALAATDGSWAGTLREKNGSPVNGARVQLRAVDRTVVAEAVSSETGAFAFTGVASGSYRVDVAIGEKNWRGASFLVI